MVAADLIQRKVVVPFELKAKQRVRTRRPGLSASYLYKIIFPLLPHAADVVNSSPTD